MNLLQVLKDHGFSDQIINIYKSSGIENLYPPQQETINQGLLKGDSILMSVPTAAGKTLMAELCMLRAVIENNGRCLYIAPLKALASEKYNDFKNKYAELNIEVGLAIGDLDSPSRSLNKYKIIVATAEKVDSLLRSKAKWLIDSLSVVVLDEIHFINDGSRGPTMEILTARIKQLNPNIQLLGLSATIKNADEMAGWLNANLVKSAWRPIPLKEGVYFQETISFEDATERLISEEAPDDVSKLSLDTLRGQGQVLIFVNSRRSAQAVSRQVSSSVSKILSPEEKTRLNELAGKIAGGQSDQTNICRKLADVIRHGAAFHHAGLKPRQRELIEENFKNNLIKVIGCTPTLAAGVNLPARRAIIRDCKRFEAGLGAAFIPTSEYKQCAGRAGRPQYDSYGEAVLIAKTHSEMDTLFERYILAEPEPVTSKLSDEASLRIHILSSIAGGYVYDIKGMLEFISHTFLHYQKQHLDLLSIISDIFEFLHREQFIEKSGFRFFTTPLGSLTSRLYIDPLTTIILRDGINLIDLNKPLSAVGLLHLITCTPDGPLMNTGKKDLENLEHFASHFHDDFILSPENCARLDDYYDYLKTIKTTWLLSQWIDEEKEDTICDQFGIGPGDIYRHIESTNWLLYAASRVAQLLHKRPLTFHLGNLKTRVRYGVREELLDIISLKGVGRVRARILFKKGYKKMSDFNYVSADELGRVKGIGKSLAASIIQQIQTKPQPQFQTTQESSEPDGWED